MTDASRPDASADVISTLDVLEHVPAPALTDFALLVRRKLRPGGLWVIKLPSTDGLYFKLAHKLLPFARPLLTGAIRRLWQSDYEYPHTVYFNRDTLQRFLEIQGFEPLGFTYLAEVPSGTVLDRLRMDPAIPRWLALLYAPGFYLINAIEGLRGKSDALLAVVRRPH